jgi:hypothetical protein
MMADDEPGSAGVLAGHFVHETDLFAGEDAGTPRHSPDDEIRFDRIWI